MSDKSKAINVTVTSFTSGSGSRKPRKWPLDVPASEGFSIGTVKWFDTSKGFGFITPKDTSQSDVFVHKSSILGSSKTGRTLMEGEDVEFVTCVDDKGKDMCKEVRGPNGESVQGVVNRRRQRRRDVKDETL